MKLETGEIEVVALDADGYVIGSPSPVAGMREAKSKAKQLISHEEYLHDGMVKVEIRDDKGECLADFFV